MRLHYIDVFFHVTTNPQYLHVHLFYATINKRGFSGRHNKAVHVRVDHYHIREHQPSNAYQCIRSQAKVYNLSEPHTPLSLWL